VRRFTRDLLVGFAVLLTSPLWMLARIGMRVRLEGPFLTCAQWLSLVPGLAGVMLRRGYYRLCLEQFATDCGVGFGTWFSHPQVRVAGGVDIGARCIPGMCEIGKNTLIGGNVDILSGRRQHHFDDPQREIRDQGGTFASVRIGRNVWIGNSTVVMADIGEGSVIGAGSVVVKPIPPGVVAAGNPCVVKKSREALTDQQEPQATSID